MTIELPLPPKACSPNRRGHWAVHSMDRKIARMTAHVKALQTRSEWPSSRRSIVITPEFFYGPVGPGVDVYRARDEDNAIGSLKSYLDGLCDAGIVQGDSRKHVSWGRPIFHSTKKAHGGLAKVVLHIEFEMPDR